MSSKPSVHIRSARHLLQNQYSYLNGEGAFDAIVPSSIDSHRAFRYASQNPWAYLDDKGYIEVQGELSPSARRPQLEIEKLLGGKQQDSQFNRSEIESIVRNLQIQLWTRRSEIWPEDDLTNPVNVLDPAKALNSIGYSVYEDDALGMYVGIDGTFEVAGIFDKPSSSVRISKQLPYMTRSFTMAHELGHAILHADVRMHRDRAIDGSMNRARNSKEYEADVFAALFLLPGKQVRLAMLARFLTECFRLNEATAFALNTGSLNELRTRCKNSRALSRILAATNHYNGKHFTSLAEHFGVSTETMAIRLEELDLLQL